ncbi:hypothetical protein Acr_24g0009940 [Actinidia rufa]|uniref:Germin-like protein n=1 Tax=Actinidia rufa TaxID=165716 RepID=A0A7J0GWA8_9ERIC|nr:hypothetical protein Acr_24g0009940 [Actinidia rufa]
MASLFRLCLPASCPSSPHIHPRSAELFVLGGSIEVGFVDTTNKLFTQTLTDGDMFVFPKGLVHYKFVSDSYRYAFTISAFASANQGPVLIRRRIS